MSESKSPAELRAERLDRLRSDWDDLRSRVSLDHLFDGIEDTASKIESLPHQIADYRKRGYRFHNNWEAEVETLEEGWPQRRRDARRMVRVRARDVKPLAKDIEELLGHSRLSDSSLDRLEDKQESLESQVDSAERDVRGTFDSLNGEIYELERQFRQVEFLLDTLDTADFDLYPDENGVAACKAVWTNHPDEPEGILILTDGRLVYEQREKKAKKKMLFITTESETVQDKLWESPIGNIEELEAEDKKKFLSRKELLHLNFHDYDWGLHGDVTLRLEDTTNEEWAGLIKRVQSGDIEADRVGAPPPGTEPEREATPPAEVPTKCPACGANLPSLVKGMRELRCEYCGTVVRL
jgi:hypothetical protein